MKNLLMCRVCLLEDDRSKSIVGTHLQEVYESLVLMPFNTTDGRPLLVCYICRARLQNCYELRKSCLESEELFTQMLSCNEYDQVKLEAINNKKRLTIHNTVEWILGMDADNVGVEDLNCEVQNDGEDVDNDVLEEKAVSNNVQPADLDDDFLITVKEEEIGYNTNIGRNNLRASSVSDELLPADSDSKNDESRGHELEMDTDSDGAETLVLLCDVKDEPNDPKDFSGDVLKGSIISVNVLSIVSDSKVENSMGVLDMNVNNVGVETLVFDVKDGQSDPEDSMMEESTNPEESSNAITIQGVHHRHYSQLSASIATTSHDCVNEPKTASDLPSIHRDYPKTAAQRMAEYRARKKKETPIVKHRKHKKHRKSDAERAKEYRARKKAKIQSADIHENGLKERNVLPALPDKNFVITVKEQTRRETVDPARKNSTQEEQLNADDSTSTGLKYHILIQNTSHDFLSEEITLATQKPHQCSICHRRFEQQRFLSSHMHSHTAVKPHQCNICKKRFATEMSLRRHFKIHVDTPFQCHICEKVFSIKSTLKMHMHTHTGEKPYRCDICNYQFAVKGSLSRHMRSHTGEKRFQCDVCKKQYTTKDSLMYHKRTHYKEKPNIRECTICNEHFERENELKLHIHTHATAETFLCDICNTVFTHKSVLRRHMCAHTGIRPKPFQCNICKKKFTVRFLLKSHMRIHTGEKPFHCHICNKQFRQKRYLTQHLRAKTCFKPDSEMTQCKVCRKKFKVMKNLVKHMRLHTDKKPYMCDICMLEFTYLYHYRRHMMSHSQE